MSECIHRVSHQVRCYECQAQSAPLASPSAEPAFIITPELRELLSRAGLAIVESSRLSMLERHWERTKCDAAADVVTDEERKVLEACAAFPTEQLTGDAYPSLANRQEAEKLSWDWSQAELARRAAKEKRNG